MAHLLNRVLATADSIDTALELAESLGWRLYQVDAAPPWGGGYFVMMQGPVGPILHERAAVWVGAEHRYSNATFKSLYGAILIALLRGLAWAKECDEDAAGYEAKAGARKIMAGHDAAIDALRRA